MSICLLYIFLGIKISSAKNIASSFNVHHFHIFAIEDANSHFESFSRLFRHFPYFNLLGWMINIYNFNPAFNCSLINLTWVYVYLSHFYWFFWKTLPIKTEKSIFQVYWCRSYKIISKYIIIIKNINFQRCASWESSFKIKIFEKLWIAYIKLIIISFIVDLIITSEV
jgi:hypothetical protein